MVNDLYPLTSHYLDLGGLRYHYLDEGEGEPLLLLHGNPTWSFYYRRLVLALRNNYRLIVPDHIGCGLSDKPADEKYSYTLEQRVKDLEALLEHLQLSQQLTLVVHDWGGMIGMAYAHRHVDRIKRLVVFNTAAFRLPAQKSLPWSLWLVRNTFLGAFLVRGLNLFCRGAVRYCCRKRLAPEVRQGYLLPYNSWANRIAVLRFVQDIPLKPEDTSYSLVKKVEEGLAQFQQTPLMICWGGRDFVFDDHFLEEWKRRFPQAEVHYFPEAGHYVLEDAAEEIIPLVREFLNQT